MYIFMRVLNTWTFYVTPGGVVVCLWVISEILFYGHYPDIQLAPDEGAQRDSPHLTPPRNEDSRRKFPPPPHVSKTFTANSYSF